MLFAIGGRVRLKHTGAEGVVHQILDENMVSVLLDDGDDIPCFVEDLIRMEDYKRMLSKKPPVKAKIVKGKSPKVPAEPDLPEAVQQYTILKSLGIQLAFEPQVRMDGITEKYLIHLINDTSYDVLFSFSMIRPNQVILKINDKLNKVSSMEVGELLFDQLNDSPTIEVECWQVTTAGTGKRFHKSLRIKAQQFFKKIRTAPILNKRVHHYLLFDNFDKETPKGEDLKSYTLRNARPSRKRNQHYASHDVGAKANFHGEIDLHIDNLLDKPRKISQSEMLRIQISAFDVFIERAIQLGVDRVFVIHGVGTGKLKNRIASSLIQNPDVKTFKNEYHPKYGFGATEVIFGAS